MKKCIIILFCLIQIISKGQDPQFTQFFSNPLYLAPSFAGATEASRITSMYRSQWRGVGDFETYTFSYDHYFSGFNSGFGVLFLKDVAGSGDLGMTSIGLQYSYDFKIFNTWHVRPGAYFNYIQTGIDYDKLYFSSQLGTTGESSGVVPPDRPAKEKVGDMDFSSSVLIYTKQFWIGGSVDHLLKPELSLYLTDDDIGYKYSLFSGVELIKKGHLLKPLDESLTFATLYKMQNDYKQLDFGLYWFKMPIVAGIWLRGIPKAYGDSKKRLQIGDALALLVGYKVQQFSVGYSYDFTISRLITSTQGSHEVSLVYHFRYQRKKKITAIPCPSF